MTKIFKFKWCVRKKFPATVVATGDDLIKFALYYNGNPKGSVFGLFSADASKVEVCTGCGCAYE